MTAYVPFVVLSAFAAAGLLVALWRMRDLERGLQRARDDAERAQAAEAAMVRRLQLAAHDIRGVGMSLMGHANQLAATAHPHASGIATGAADLLDLADDVQDITLGPRTQRVLREEVLELGAVVDEAIASVSSAILPSRRNWRVHPRLRAVRVKADRRACRHAISRLLADAARGTRHDDWIDLEGSVTADGYMLVVADEGRGAQGPEENGMRRNSRGIGLRLALAQALIEAHGGRMEVEAVTGIGSRVGLVFPSDQVVLTTAVIHPSDSCAA